MKKVKNKSERKRRREKFMEELFPKLQKYFPTREIQNGFKIEIAGQEFDYYPGGEKLLKCPGKDEKYSKGSWSTISNEDFYNSCMNTITKFDEDDEWLDPFDYFDDDDIPDVYGIYGGL